ncbi:hypothetical protein N7528_001779 [Penicillium herquei]|nr:hypothetical protein N7528_001779 [Penicillium herquei]
MSFTNLPPEILLQIAFWIDVEADLASLAQVNRALYNTLITELYLLNAKNPEKSAILIAAKTGNCSTLQKALQAWKVAKGPAKLPTSGTFPKKYPPLLSAAIKGHTQAVKVLLEYGVDPNERDYDRRTPLNVASTGGHTEAVKILLAQPNIQVNTYDRDQDTPMIGAARNGHAKIVKMLLSAGAFAGCVRKGGQSPLPSAIMNKQAKLVRLLVNRKDIDPNALCLQRTPLELAVTANREDLVEILLTDKRVNPDLTICRTGKTPLLEAAMKNNAAMVQLLLKAGANKEIQDSTFLSPAMLLDAPSAEARYKLLQDHDAAEMQMLSNRRFPED